MSAALSMLGVTAGDGPRSLDLERAVYRDALAGRRALIVLDGVVFSDQVTPLLAGEETCFLITSSRQLHDLCGPNRLVYVDGLSVRESRQLLNELLAVENATMPLEELTELRELCEGLPAALHIVASHVATGYYTDIRSAVETLRADPAERLAELSYGRLSVGASYARALATCDAMERYVLGLMARGSTSATDTKVMEETVAPDISGGAVAARRAIRGLIQANLLHMVGPSASGPSFALSPLCQAFAATALDMPKLAGAA